MSMMGKLSFFLEIKINHGLEGSYLQQSKYIREILQMFDMVESKPAKTPMHPTYIMGKDEESKKVQ